jgi:hypothetical protein
MTFEIGNPSDKCFLNADDPKIAAACILFLGGGQYFCKNAETEENIPGTFFALGGDIEDVWKKSHGIGFKEFISKPETKSKMRLCFSSFYYATEGSSFNNIGKRAQKFAETLPTIQGEE